ncbi:hypothetical protein I317_01035 [Kwoniella heveanensis CBS 569]|nr:hypothetical protein I317_01035 [Kwoniella heveanensis CBS 569]
MSFMNSNVDWLRSHQTAPSSSVYGSQFPNFGGLNANPMNQQQGYFPGQAPAMRPSWGGGSGYPPYGSNYTSYPSTGYHSPYPQSGVVVVDLSYPSGNSAPTANAALSQTTTASGSFQSQQPTTGGSTATSGAPVRVNIPLGPSLRSSAFPDITDRSSAYLGWLRGHASALSKKAREYSETFLPRSRKQCEEAEHAYNASAEDLRKVLYESVQSCILADDPWAEYLSQHQQMLNKVTESATYARNTLRDALKRHSAYETNSSRVEARKARIDDEISRVTLERPTQLSTQRVLQNRKMFGQIVREDAEGNRHQSPWDSLVDGVLDQHKIADTDRFYSSTADKFIPLSRMQSNVQSSNGTGSGTASPTSATGTQNQSGTSQATNDPYANMGRSIWNSGIQAMNGPFPQTPPYGGYPYLQPSSVQSTSPHFTSHVPAQSSYQPSPGIHSFPSHYQASVNNPNFTKASTPTQSSPWFTSSQQPTTNSSVPSSGQQYYYR